MLPRAPKNNPRCRRFMKTADGKKSRCRMLRSEHVGPSLYCAQSMFQAGRYKTFQPARAQAKRAALSVSLAQATLLDMMLKSMLAGGDTSRFIRHKEFASLARIIGSAKKRAESSEPRTYNP